MPTQVPEALKGGWTFDKRTVVGAGLGLLCLGIIIGFRLAGGVPEITTANPPTFGKPEPCVDCAEKAIQEQRGSGVGEQVITQPETPSGAIPGT